MTIVANVGRMAMRSQRYDRDFHTCQTPSRAIPPQHHALFREWVLRAEQVGYDRFELADGIAQILNEFSHKGEYMGASFLGLWTRMLREEINSHSDCC
jgi:hypothetical protein